MNRPLKDLLSALETTEASVVRMRALGHAIRPDVPTSLEQARDEMDARPYQAWIAGAPRGKRTGLSEQERKALLDAGATDVEQELDATS